MGGAPERGRIGQRRICSENGDGMTAVKERKVSVEATLRQLATRCDVAEVRDDVRATGDRLARRLYALGVGVAILIALEIVSIGVSLAWLPWR